MYTIKDQPILMGHFGAIHGDTVLMEAGLVRRHVNDMVFAGDVVDVDMETALIRCRVLAYYGVTDCYVCRVLTYVQSD